MLNLKQIGMIMSGCKKTEQSNPDVVRNALLGGSFQPHLSYWDGSCTPSHAHSGFTSYIFGVCKEQEHIIQFRGNLDSVRFTGSGVIARTQYLNGTWSPPYHVSHQKVGFRPIDLSEEASFSSGQTRCKLSVPQVKRASQKEFWVRLLTYDAAFRMTRKCSFLDENFMVIWETTE